MGKIRTFRYFRPFEHDRMNFHPEEPLRYDHFEFKALDRFRGDLELLVIPVESLHRISEILSELGLNDSREVFEQQCREVISVPEKHINEQTGKGQVTFRVHFKNVPGSLASINGRALVVLCLHLLQDRNRAGKSDYRVAGYAHVNSFDYMDHPTGRLLPSYYYNLLRVSSYSENGNELYRQCGMFATIFSVFDELTKINGVNVGYANFGKENRGMQRSMDTLSRLFKKGYHKFHVDSYIKIHRLFRSRRWRKHLVDISDDESRLREFHEKNIKERGRFLLHQYPTYDSFKAMFEGVRSHSSTSRVYMLPGKDGEMLAAAMAVNWGDYFALTLEKPRGLFKLVASMKVMDQILWPIHSIGEKRDVAKLWKGLAYLYEKESGVHLSLMMSQPGDPYARLKRSMLHDPFVYFTMYNRQDEYLALEASCRLRGGGISIFTETPLT